jgi:tRNA (cmo5U34)-methyltransferase
MSAQERSRFDFESAYGATYQDRIRRIVPGYDDLTVMMLGELIGLTPASAHLLIIGAGGGEEIAVMGAARPRWRFTGVDPSAQMIGLTRNRIEKQGLGGRVTLLHGTADALPPGPAFDAATVALVMHFMAGEEAKLALLQDVARRLRPGAPLVLVDGHGDAGSPEFAAEFEAWMRYLTLRGMSAEEHEGYRGQVTASCHFVPEARIRALLTEAGFTGPRIFYRGYIFGGWVARLR